MASLASAQTAPQLLPYTTKVIAGGGASTPAKGGACPVSGYIATDAYGDGCLATEVLLGTGASTPGPRAAAADPAGDVFFGDYVNGVIHRIDAQTGVLTAVVGGAASSPASGATCGANLSTDSKGDGCLASLVHLSHPTAVIFATNGDLFFADYGYGQVRKVSASNQSVISVIPQYGGSGYTTAPTVTIAPPASGTPATATATITNGTVTSVTITNPGSGYTSTPAVTFSAAPSGGITATAVAVNTGIVTLVAGSASGTFGYTVSTPTTPIIAATQSVLDGPYALALDAQGDLFIADEYTAAVLVVNTNSTGSNTVNNVAVPAGQIWKIAGTITSGGPYCTTGSGCTYNHTYTENTQANYDYLRAAYGMTVDSLGNVFITNEYYDTIQKVAPSGVLTTYVGTQNTAGKTTARGVAPGIAIGSPFGVAADPNNNLYFTDAADGTVWRVDAGTQNQYLIGSGFGSSGTGFASTTLPGPGIFSISVDSNANVYFGDTEKNTVTEIASGTQFGVVGVNQPVDTLDIHFAPGDKPAAIGAYTITAGTSGSTSPTNFSLGTATCTYNNNDSTTDCLLPITAKPATLGLFTASLHVTSSLGVTGTFPLSGLYVQTPVTFTSVSYTSSVICSGSTTYSSTTPFTLTAALTTNGPSTPGGTITFYANNGTSTSAIGTSQNVTNIGTSAAPVYGANLTYTFATLGTYTISAVYSGDPYYKTSTGVNAKPITSATAGFTATAIVYQQPTVAAGQTALYSFNLVQNVYTGTITFACSGLPSDSACVFSPSSITASGCSTTSTVAMSITTQSGVATAGLGGGTNPWSAISMLAALGLALVLGLRRRKLPLLHQQLCMAFALLLASSGLVACSSSKAVSAPTPSGAYTVTVTATGSNAVTSTFTVPFTVK